MTRNCKVLFLFCLLLGLGVGLLPAVPAGAVDVSDPVLDTIPRVIGEGSTEIVTSNCRMRCVPVSPSLNLARH